ncbi:alpha-1-antichymotrypsin [Fukomys damarensis]|uniref:Alpha-1-antichymotrypsin n=1 Tax=Fukomys damarensis TaxID=885580 RepID=A0A091CQD7_FUKDA|nr:alpha-1-antichymotrypsin [Fukomys damarensis]KFO21354.1 Alpha-1-antichymotrypsin [Fukomys damarensis]
MSLLLALGLLVAGLCPAIFCHPCGPGAQETVTPNDGDSRVHMDTLTVASSNADFAFNLYKKLTVEVMSENIIFSPVSILAALAVMSLGALNAKLMELLQGLRFNLTETPEAEIHRSIQHFLRTLRQPNDKLQLSMGNALFIQEQLQLLSTFTENARSLYAAETFTTNFQDPNAAEKLINDFVKKETQGKISGLVKGLDPRTMVVLVNYVFFKGTWKMPFDPRNTLESKFYLSPRRWVLVPMMKLANQRIPYFREEALSCTVVELPYTGNASALLILPDQGRIPWVEEALSWKLLKQWRDSLQPRWIDEFYLPKFSISRNYQLESILPELGIREVFSPKADLSGITGARDLQISQFFHRAVLDVAENGTEATATTGIKLILTSAKVDPVIVNFIRPFLITILDKEINSVLFMSRVLNPKPT